MKEKLEKQHNVRIIIWIYWITMLTGAINIYAFKKLGTFVTHQTGNLTQLAIQIYSHSPASIQILAIIISFFMGSFVSGLLYHDKQIKPKKRYGMTLIIGGMVLIVLDIFKITMHQIDIIAFWMGIQNGMLIKYKGALVRTSHMTGYITDAGVALGNYMRGHKSELWKIRFYLFSIVYFILGGILGLFIIQYFNKPLSLIGSLYILSGIYLFYIRYRKIEAQKIQISVGN